MTPPWLRGVRAAATFLTRVPVGGFPYRDDDWRWASAHFPLIGAAVGAAGALARWLALPVSPMVAGALAVAVTVLITGGFHEDGLADTADALGGAYDRARVLEILKDSRIGAFGGAALVAALLLRFALLAALGDRAPLALVISEGVSRLPPVVLMALLPYATDDARARSRQIARAGAGQVALAGGWTTAILVAAIAGGGLTPLGAAAVLAAITGAGVVAGWRFVRRVGGVTGDFLGATQQVAVVAALIALRAVA